MKFNLNKIFPFLSIRKKLIIAFALLSSIPLFILGIVGIYISWQSMREIAVENLTPLRFYHLFLFLFWV